MIFCWIIDWPRVASVLQSNRQRVQVPLVCVGCQYETMRDARQVLVGKEIPKTCSQCIPSKSVAFYSTKPTELTEEGAVINWGQCGSKRDVRVDRVKIMKMGGLCQLCANLLKNSQQSMEQNGRWKGGRVKSREYVDIRIPKDHPMISMSPKGKNTIPEHRLVVALAIGRPLESWEHVHHINGIKNDNRLENLQIVSPDKHCSITALEREVRRLRKELEAMKIQQDLNEQ